MKVKAYEYRRVSGIAQIEGDGFLRQHECCSRFAKSHDIDVIEAFEERGVSGTTDSYDRPALSALFESLKLNSDIKLVLLEQSSRLARDLMIGEILLEQFRKLGVRVISCECGSELTNEDGNITQKLIRQVLMAFSEYEKSALVAKLKVARGRIRAAKGFCEGRKAFGVSPEEQAVIARIVDLNRAGTKATAIAGLLNEERISPRKATRAGKQAKWHPAMIYRILERQTQSELSAVSA